MTELFDLFVNVTKESVARPMTNEHDEIDWTSPNEHGHIRSQLDGVCPNFIGFDVEYVFTN